MKPKIAAVVLISWIVLSLAVLIGGIVIGEYVMMITGIVLLFGGGFLVAVIMVIALFVQAKHELDAEQDMRKAEQESLRRINSTYRAENRNENAKRMFKQMILSWRASGGKEKVLGCLFLFTFIACCAMFVVFAWFGKPVYGIIAWGVGVGMIIIAFIVVKIKEHVSLSVKDIKPRKDGKPSKAAHDPTAKFMKAPVKHCVLSSQSGPSTNRSSYVSNVTYKVTLEIDGNDVTCYSHEFFNEGDSVNVFSWKNGKRVLILCRVENNENSDSESKEK